MRKIISIIPLLALLVVAGCQKDPKEPQTPNPQKPQGSYKALFHAEPATLTAAGGDGTILGILQELSAEGEKISSKPLKPSEYTLKLLTGDATQITLDEVGKTFSVVAGSTTTFEIEATVTSGAAKGQKQSVKIVRGGSVSYSFEAAPSQFTATGGKGVVTGKCTYTDTEGKVIDEKALAASDFTLTLKAGKASELTIDDAQKSFTVAEGTEAADFTLEAKPLAANADATELTIHREAAPQPKLLLPLELVAEYNIGIKENEFAATKASNVSGYFTYEDAVSKFSKVTINGKKYHLPSRQEWESIIPYDTKVNLGFAKDLKAILEKVVVAGEELQFTSDFYSEGAGWCVALRYKGTKYVSAWKYRIYSDEFGSKSLEITARKVTDQTTIEDIKGDSFWSQTDDSKVVRIFPASGRLRDGSVSNQGSRGYFWSSTPHESDATLAYGCYFDKNDASTYYNGKRTNGRTVRLFIDK